MNAVDAFVDSTAGKIAEYIHRNADNSSSPAVLKMSLITIFNFVIVFGLVLIVCLFTGRVTQGLAAVFCLPLLRYFSGGLHTKSANLCNLVSAGMILLAAHAPIAFWNTGLILSFVSIGLLLLFAPQGITNLSRLDQKYYPVLKLISVGIVAANFLIQSPTLAGAFFLQALTTIPVTQKIIDRYNL